MWLTRKQRKVLRVFIQHRRVPLTNREAGMLCGKAPQKAEKWARSAVEKLSRKGLLLHREIDGKKGLLASEKALNPKVGVLARIGFAAAGRARSRESESSTALELFDPSELLVGANRAHHCTNSSMIHRRIDDD